MLHPTLPSGDAPPEGGARLQPVTRIGSVRLRPRPAGPSLVYRALREIETSGLVTSEWDKDSLGPQRRVYKITPEGEGYLAEWMQDLRRTRREIEALEAAYEQVEQPE